MENSFHTSLHLVCARGSGVLRPNTPRTRSGCDLSHHRAAAAPRVLVCEAASQPIFFHLKCYTSYPEYPVTHTISARLAARDVWLRSGGPDVLIRMVFQSTEPPELLHLPDSFRTPGILPPPAVPPSCIRSSGGPTPPRYRHVRSLPLVLPPVLNTPGVI